MYQFEDIEETIITFDSTNCLGTARNFLTDNFQRGKWAPGSKFMIVHFARQSDQLENPYVINESKPLVQICLVCDNCDMYFNVFYRLWRKT